MREEEDKRSQSFHVNNVEEEKNEETRRPEEKEGKEETNKEEEMAEEKREQECNGSIQATPKKRTTKKVTCL